MTLLTYHDANYKSLANATNPIIKKYCEKHNYVFRSRNEPYLAQGRPSSWAKINAIKEEFEKTSDWIFWIDTDAAITNHQVKIENIIDENYNSIFSPDGCEWISACCFAIKKTNDSIKLLNKIWDQPNEVINHCWWENLALMKVLENDSDLRKTCKIIEYKKIFSQIQNWNKGDFIMHIGGGLRVGEKKADMMNHFLNSNSIVY
jgi:hypothetical protein